MPKQKRQWRVWVEVEVDVEAFDAASAEKKVDKLFSSKRELAPDIRLDGAAYTVYEAEAAQAVA